MSEIEYFYSAHSAFAYLGSARLMEIASAAGRRIAHRPVNLDRVIAAVGSPPFLDRSDKFRAYFFVREMDRWAEIRNVPVMDGRPTYHYEDMTLPNCFLIAGIVAGLNIDRLAHALLEAHRRDDADLTDVPTLTTLAESVGIDAVPLLDAAGTSEIQAIYEANTEEAIARSVFGSPTYFVDGDMFYGQDRLEMVERALRQPFAGEWPPR